MIVNDQAVIVVGLLIRREGEAFAFAAGHGDIDARAGREGRVAAPTAVGPVQCVPKSLDQHTQGRGRCQFSAVTLNRSEINPRLYFDPLFGIFGVVAIVDEPPTLVDVKKRCHFILTGTL